MPHGKKNITKHIPIKEEVKLSIFTNHMISREENVTESTKTLLEIVRGGFQKSRDNAHYLVIPLFYEIFRGAL